MTTRRPILWILCRWIDNRLVLMVLQTVRPFETDKETISVISMNIRTNGAYANFPAPRFALEEARYRDQRAKLIFESVWNNHQVVLFVCTGTYTVASLLDEYSSQIQI